MLQRFTSRTTWFSVVLSVLLIIGVWTWAAETAPHEMKLKGPGVAVMSSASVKDTVAKLKKLIADGGMMVMGELNQGKALSMTGLKLESETVFVGNPQVGKKAFVADPGVGIILPVRINVHTCPRGGSIVRYIPPSRLLSEFNNADVQSVALMLDEKLNKMVSMIK